MVRVAAEAGLGGVTLGIKQSCPDSLALAVDARPAASNAAKVGCAVGGGGAGFLRQVQQRGTRCVDSLQLLDRFVWFFRDCICQRE